MNSFVLANAGDNCDECELRGGAVLCLTCDDHFFLDLCQPCDDDKCLSCTTAADQCESCIEGYYVTDSSNCAGKLIFCSIKQYPSPS